MPSTTANITTAAIDRVEVAAYKIPTDLPESDGTLKWDSTTIVVVHAHGGGETGLGYSYTHAAAADLIHSKLAGLIEGRDAMAIPAAWTAMTGAIRNLGRPGICSNAISAIDCAMWDLKARLLGLPLVTLLGAAREEIDIYGSGGFTSYSDAQIAEQLTGWVEQGIPRVKIKVGRDAAADPHRVAVARRAIGDETELFVDANSGYALKQALEMGRRFHEEHGVCWYEEPQSSDNLHGLRLMCERGPAGMDIAAGEYGYHLPYFRRMLDAGAVDCLQADVTRCSGITGFLGVAALCEARHMPLSAHCAPAASAHVCCAAGPVRHIEYFHDHVRIEDMLFDGTLDPTGGALRPDTSRPGMGLTLKRADAERYAV